MPIEFIDLKILNEEEIPILNKLVKEYYTKFERDLKNPKLIIHFKKYKKSGNQVKYSIHSRIDSPSIILSANAHDWDFARTLHKVFKKLEQEFQHKFKTEGQKQERFHPKRSKRGTDTRVKLRLRGKIR